MTTCMELKKTVEFDQAITSLESQFTSLIQKRLGIVLHAHQHYELFKTIKEACEQFDLTPSQYLEQLLDCSNQSPLLNYLVSGITVGETYFFRDQQQMDLLQNQLLPEIITQKRHDKSYSIRIWSAGCATGEEIYSISMLLYELLPDIEKWTIKLLATDINTMVLKKAITGIYNEWSMRSISDYFKNKYFCKEDHKYHLEKKVKQLVNFDYLNLTEDNYPSIFNGTNAQDLIICRNVLIYIDNSNCMSLMNRLDKSLVEGGYLMLGASDPISISETDLVAHSRKASVFTKTIKSNPIIEIPNKIAISNVRPVKKIFISKVIKQPPKKIVHQKNIPVVTTDLLSKAIDLANIGKLSEAIKLCKQGFQLDPTNKLNYYTYGLAMSELNNLSEAESALRKTLFLDSQFVAGHFQLGLLLLRKNQPTAGLKSLKNALSIAESKQSEEPVPGAPGLRYKDITEILRKEINLYAMSES